MKLRTKACSTFDKFPCLSAHPQFKVDHVEAWGCIPVRFSGETTPCRITGVTLPHTVTSSIWTGVRTSFGAKREHLK